MLKDDNNYMTTTSNLAKTISITPHTARPASVSGIRYNNSSSQQKFSHKKLDTILSIEKLKNESKNSIQHNKISGEVSNERLDTFFDYSIPNNKKIARLTRPSTTNAKTLNERIISQFEPKKKLSLNQLIINEQSCDSLFGNKQQPIITSKGSLLKNRLLTPTDFPKSILTTQESKKAGSYRVTSALCTAGSSEGRSKANSNSKYKEAYSDKLISIYLNKHSISTRPISKTTKSKSKQHH